MQQQVRAIAALCVISSAMEAVLGDGHSSDAVRAVGGLAVMMAVAEMLMDFVKG